MATVAIALCNMEIRRKMGLNLSCCVLVNWKNGGGERKGKQSKTVETDYTIGGPSIDGMAHTLNGFWGTLQI